MAKLLTKQAMKSPFPVENVLLNFIDLDLRNSRFPRDAQSQIDALELMLETAGDDCFDLMRDLTKTGEMNSSDLPIAVLRNERYVIMEGNRRLTCLRLWHSPELLSQSESLGNQYLSRIQRLVQESAYLPPTKLRVTVAPSETDADVWIDRKHTGGSGGKGTIQWSAAMKDRRRARNDPTKASRAMAFVELASREYKDERDFQSSLEIVRTKRYTMIQRFVDRSVVRDMLGLNLTKGTMTFRFGSQATLPIIRQVFSDFAKPKADSGKTWARELDTVDDFRNYLNNYAELLPSKELDSDLPGTHGSHPDSGSRSSQNDSSGEQAPGENKTEASQLDETVKATDSNDPRPARPSPTREYIFRGLILDNFTPRIQGMVRLTSLLNVKRQNEIAAVMLRVILDLTTYQFLKSHSKEVPKYLDRRIKEAIKVIEPNASDTLGAAENTSPLRKAFHNTTSDNIQLVQYAVHDIHSGSIPAETFTLADRYTPVLNSMNINMGNTPVA